MSREGKPNGKAARRAEREAAAGAGEATTIEPAVEVAPTAEVMGLSDSGKGFFERMSDKGKNILYQAYEKVLGAPGALWDGTKRYATDLGLRTVAKTEIGYSQFWANKHEKKTAVLKGKLDVFDMQTKMLTQNKESLRRTIDNLKRQGMPGTTMMELAIKNFDRQIANIASKRDPIQSRFESQERKLAKHINARDQIANEMISNYDAELGPIEKKLEFLSSCKESVNQAISDAEAAQQEQLRELDATDRQIAETEEMLLAMGYSPRQVKKMYVQEKATNVATREMLRTQLEPYLARRTALEERIRLVDQQANPYRDRRDRYARITGLRPLDLGVETRTREEGSREREDIEGTTRRESESIAEYDQEVDEGDEEPKEFAVRELIKDWNAYLTKTYAKAVIPENGHIDQAVLTKMYKLGADSTITAESFMDVVGAYYKRMHTPMPVEFNSDVKAFISAHATEQS
ncbi:hypothetical protein COU19_01170 [Candidatus Kaiserbacteria bacterium CG10_big_fil_rev_8_21_14_0_10_56_12]|uniref:Uncharacterized protein n=1 Tax=Candidatus Kaiserbacteria bacterium CG10_big_fil_rev_8_21_14_0_10_56_12 TaxID=1974611 RepID=A0A2H0UC28_9BACT|nr:MAG: hypothetical protein COU19_01170 [Candidatus Kaiserbacteria bacterium CG10_big_fil_rev_8_21_14_0_10_56_12]